MMRVVSGEEMRQIDRFTMKEIGLAGEVLMENAGRAVVASLTSKLSMGDKITVLIGSGNNGGDGFVIARGLLELGYFVDVWLIPSKNRIKGEALYHMNVFERSGFQLQQYSEKALVSCLPTYTVIIDTLLGTGVEGPLRSPYKEIIPMINRLSAKIISVDIPSGLPSDGGMNFEDAVRAENTVTLHLPKIGAYTYPSADYYGQLDIVDIGIPDKSHEVIKSNCFLWKENDVKRTLPVRMENSHKGTYGKAMILAGSREMTGAAILAAKSCHRAGSGLVTLAIPEEIHPIVASNVIEATFSICPSKDGSFHLNDCASLLSLSEYNGVGVGPGIGRKSSLEPVIADFLENTQCPLVIDADGLYHLHALLPQLKSRQGETILTPHTGEMARLLGCQVKDVEENRFSLSKQFAKEYGVFLILKGPYTIVTTPDERQFINTTGTPAPAKGGSGDVLTGMILAFIMQHTSIQEALSNAVYFHGKTAELLVEKEGTEFDILSSDLIQFLPKALRTVVNG
ncbi:NAD(P)H-hydrate dehydratase [Bacillus sp. FJAT-45350]|uniref:NAD(P)H-hydrate dehydratase n=1 Tax=Bacillus sp. FJAT-45350 TaxID=2011014 RepID=UPI00211CC7CC|nr:NAD(P)H-hydrate dehydratase [Bacillus sp. FJAT-45350]